MTRLQLQRAHSLSSDAPPPPPPNRYNQSAILSPPAVRWTCPSVSLFFSLSTTYLYVCIFLLVTPVYCGIFYLLCVFDLFVWPAERTPGYLCMSPFRIHCAYSVRLHVRLSFSHFLLYVPSLLNESLFGTCILLASS